MKNENMFILEAKKRIANLKLWYYRFKLNKKRIKITIIQKKDFIKKKC